MDFCEQLNKYIEQLNCSSKELVIASGLSSAVISRYRNGERTPNIRSRNFSALLLSLNVTVFTQAPFYHNELLLIS